MSANAVPVSVVIPTYNCAPYVGQAIDSALAQDYGNLEIVVVDDGSTDETAEIVRSYGNQVRFFCQRNQGSAVARNLGIEQARGEYIAFLDGDDYWRKDKLALQMDAIGRLGHKMAYSRFIWWKPDATGRYSDPSTEFAATSNPNRSSAAIVTGWNYADLLLDCIVWTSTVVVERDLLIRSGLFAPQFRKGQDYELWIRLSRLTPMIGLDEAIALYRIHGHNITHRVSDRCYEYEILSSALNTWGEAGPDNRAPPKGQVQTRLARMLLNHGYAHLRGGNPTIAVEFLHKLLNISGPNPRYLALLLLAYGRKVRARLARVPSSRGEGR